MQKSLSGFNPCLGKNPCHISSLLLCFTLNNMIKKIKSHILVSCPIYRWLLKPVSTLFLERTIFVTWQMTKITYYLSKWSYASFFNFEGNNFQMISGKFPSSFFYQVTSWFVFLSFIKVYVLCSNRYCGWNHTDGVT